MAGGVVGQTSEKAEGQDVCRIVVIGSGIAGLAAAYYLKQGLGNRSNVELLVLERFGKAGGSISTYHVDDFILELGPDSFLTEKPEALQFCKDLGLEDQIIGTNPECRSSFVAFNNKLHPLPAGFAMLAPTQLGPFFSSELFSWSGKMRMAMELFVPKAPPNTDESLAQFVRRRLGQEALDRIAQPMLGGVYTADPELLSLRATMPRFMDLEQKHGSLIRGLSATRRNNGDSGARYSMFASLERGLGQLVDKAVEALGPAHMRYQSAVVAVEKGVRGKAFDVVLARGSILPCDAVVIASPSYTAGDLLAGMDPDLSQKLKKIQYASSAVLNLIYNRRDIPHPMDGFGFVVPITEKRNILACSFSSIKFPGRCPPDQAILRVFIGGALQTDLFDFTDEQTECLVWEDLHTYMGIDAVPMLSLITRYPRAMPQYHIGHLDLVSQIEQRVSALPGLALAGNAYRGVGLPDCIRSGRTAADNILKTISSPATPGPG
ncbi:MAG: protoporphyrinogen oxidase [Candidatus Obscuribacterales bacterium]|nr:protoporphyrinogen oxidase [Candidatus Obscuribacterales bacterium]